MPQIQRAVSALVNSLSDNNATFAALRAYFTEETALAATETTPFSSARKWSSASFGVQGTVLIGAPDIRLHGRNFCLPSAIRHAEEKGCRVLLAAFSKEPVSGTLPHSLRPLAAVILQDPIRPDAKETLDFFKRQGVSFKIISGYNPVTVAGLSLIHILFAKHIYDIRTKITDCA